MSLRLEMLQVARLAPRALGDAAERVAAFLSDQWTEAGGGKDRAGDPDLYYTVFALEAMHALQLAAPAALPSYLASFGDGEDLDLVHLCCLVRAYASLGDVPSSVGRAAVERLSGHRAADGAYAATPGADRGTIYHSFLAVAAHQDLREPLPDQDALARCVLALRCDDGSFSNEASVRVGNTPTTAAAVALLRQLGQDVPSGPGEWLLARCRPDGGFVALPGIPLPDLLSTATALHALQSMHVELESVREPTLDFIDTLWTGRAFCGSWADDIVDAEYTYYALLALGHLAV